MSSRIGKAQGSWLRSVQKRLNATASMLGSIKGIKMLGLTDYISTFIQRMRVEEIVSSLSYRKLLVFSIVLCK